MVQSPDYAEHSPLFVNGWLRSSVFITSFSHTTASLPYVLKTTRTLLIFHGRMTHRAQLHQRGTDRAWSCSLVVRAAILVILWYFSSRDIFEFDLHFRVFFSELVPFLQKWLDGICCCWSSRLHPRVRSGCVISLSFGIKLTLTKIRCSVRTLRLLIVFSAHYLQSLLYVVDLPEKYVLKLWLGRITNFT